MKKELTILVLSLFCKFQVSAQNTEMVTDDKDLFAPFRTVYRHIEHVGFSTPPRSQRQGSMLKHHIYQRRDLMNDTYYKEIYKEMKEGKSYDGFLYNSGISISSSDYSSVRIGGSKKGKSVSDMNMESKRRQVNKQVAFAVQKRLAMEEARRKDEEKKRIEKALDDQRAAMATEEANARMQSVTNSRIALDRYNAGEGLQNAREASRNNAVARIRGYVKPRRIMHQTNISVTNALHKRHTKRNDESGTALQKKNNSLSRSNYFRSYATLKQPKPYVYRKIPKNGKYEFTGRMNITSIYIEPDSRFGVPDKYSAPKTIASNKGFRLSPNAVVNTGQLINTGVLTMKEIPPRPKSNMPHDKDMDEKLREFFPEYYK